jgi:hypothetical protein
VVDFVGDRFFPNILDFFNTEFGTFRRSDGHLNSRAGIIPDAFPIVEKFMNSEVKEGEVKKMQRTEGGDYYVSIMNKLRRWGIGALDNETRKQQIVLRNSANDDFLDIAIKNLNVIGEFRRAGPFVVEPEKEL